MVIGGGYIGCELAQMFARAGVAVSILCRRRLLPEAEPERSRHIADFIAGMTDRYAVRCYQDVVGAIDLPEGF